MLRPEAESARFARGAGCAIGAVSPLWACSCTGCSSPHGARAAPVRRLDTRGAEPEGP